WCRAFATTRSAACCTGRPTAPRNAGGRVRPWVGCSSVCMCVGSWPRCHEQGAGVSRTPDNACWGPWCASTMTACPLLPKTSSGLAPTCAHRAKKLQAKTLTGEKQPGFQTEPQILVEPHPQAGLALGGVQVVERPHLPLVRRAPPDLPGAGRVELAVGGVAI